MAPAPGSNRGGCGVWNKNLRDDYQGFLPAKVKHEDYPVPWPKAHLPLLVCSGLHPATPAHRCDKDRGWQKMRSLGIHSSHTRLYTSSASRGYTRCPWRPLLTMSEAWATIDGIQNAHSGGNTQRQACRTPWKSNRAMSVSAQGACSTYKPDGSNAATGCCHAVQWGWHQDHGRHHTSEDPWWHLVLGANIYTYSSCLGGIFLYMMPNAFWYRPKKQYESLSVQHLYMHGKIPIWICSFASSLNKCWLDASCPRMCWVLGLEQWNCALLGHLSKWEATNVSCGTSPPHYGMPDYVNDQWNVINSLFLTFLFSNVWKASPLTSQYSAKIN